MTRWTMVLAVLGFGACGGEEGDKTTTTSENCTTEWSCENNVCECADGSSCADETECDSVCEVCD